MFSLAHIFNKFCSFLKKEVTQFKVPVYVLGILVLNALDHLQLLFGYNNHPFLTTLGWGIIVLEYLNERNANSVLRSR